MYISEVNALAIANSIAVPLQLPRDITGAAARQRYRGRRWSVIIIIIIIIMSLESVSASWDVIGDLSSPLGSH